MIPLTRPLLGGAELEAIRRVLDTGMLVQGAQVAAFEQALADYLGAAHVLAVHTGTTAIHIALLAAGVGPGDEVIVPDFCFPSVAAAVLHTGADCVLCDVDPNTFNTSRHLVDRAKGPGTRFALAVHQFGVPCSRLSNMGLTIIEDAACALGARDADGLCGASSTAGCFSFHPRKIITTAEGGAVVTNDPALAQRVSELRNHGMSRTPAGIAFNRIGHAGRMSEVHAAIGLAQMPRLPDILTGRAAAARHYRGRLSTIDGVLTSPATWHDGRAYQSLVVRIDPDIAARDHVVASLKQRGIESTIGTYAIHRLPVFAERCRLAPGGLSGSRVAADTSVTLPLWHDMHQGDIDRVCDALRAVLGG